MNILTAITNLITSAFASQPAKPTVSVLTIDNSQTAPIRIYLEPWGDGYTIQPDQAVAVRINNQGHQLQTALVALPGGDLQLYIDNTMLLKGAVEFGVYTAEGTPIEPD
ncbi:MAG TPA: hypothetical protein VGE07_14935 [Herpetosiphonaceae bacterium]